MDDVTSAGAGGGGGAAPGVPPGLEAVLVRLVDPATSTRRTAAARTRLANDPTTRALLEAGVAVLMEEIGGTGEVSAAGSGVAGLPQARFLEVLSARRVAAAATAAGPLRVTSWHLRDRWPRSAPYVDDLLAYALWPQHWLTAYATRMRDLQPPAGPADVPRVLAAVADATLVVGALPISSRLEVLASALGPVRPGLRAERARAQARLNATWATAWTELFRAAGYRPRSPRHLLDGVRAAAALAEGANLRLLALGDTPERRAEAVRLLVAGGTALARACLEPAEPAEAPGAPGARGAPGGAFGRWPVWAADPEGDLPAVLTRLTDPLSGARRTAAARERLARDGITRQLLVGGLEVLAEEFGVTRPRPGGAPAPPPAPSRFFDVLSVARVVQVARAAGGAGASATSARLRDRWPNREHFVDDVVAFAVRDASLVVASVPDQRPRTGVELRDATRRSAEAAFTSHDRSPGLRLRLLLTTLARARPVVAARLREAYAREDAVVAARLEAVATATGAGLRDDVDPTDLCRAIGALGEGTAMRVLATGDDGRDDPGAAGESLALRAATWIYWGAMVQGVPPHRR
ncbi:hypothetical protein [Quadrisphaera sp. INWT6]|uniref:hypothetical protein n=1 Tax=Quadrisphaera sp. INWT6 TaxID=2596917 RepID=UPI001891F950|nr:hypothetical protein [Quadrisphaera sp. INWT6]MBF5080298.1 hypothetical protein [Quadrisphaera sp. INWT6]